MRDEIKRKLKREIRKHFREKRKMERQRKKMIFGNEEFHSTTHDLKQTLKFLNKKLFESREKAVLRFLFYREFNHVNKYNDLKVMNLDDTIRGINASLLIVKEAFGENFSAIFLRDTETRVLVEKVTKRVLLLKDLSEETIKQQILTLKKDLELRPEEMGFEMTKGEFKNEIKRKN